MYGCFRGAETSTWTYNVITRAKSALHLYTEIPTGTGDMGHFWKAVLQRDDEQIAALLQAEEAVRERVVEEVRKESWTPSRIGAELDFDNSPDKPKPSKPTPPRLTPDPPGPRRPNGPSGPI